MRSIVIAVVLTGATLLGAAPATAACAAPELSVAPATGAPGDRVTLTGQRFYSTCTDTVENGQTVSTPSGPDQGMKVQFVQGERVVELGSASADAQFRFQQEVIVPADAADGDATFRVVGKAGSPTADFRVIKTLPLPGSSVVTQRGTTTSGPTTSTSSTSTTFLSTTTSEESTTTTESTTTSTTRRAVKEKDDDDDSSWPLILGALGALVVVGGGLFLLFRRSRTGA